jgi:hypothetical protein
MKIVPGRRSGRRRLPRHLLNAATMAAFAVAWTEAGLLANVR